MSQVPDAIPAKLEPMALDDPSPRPAQPAPSEFERLASRLRAVYREEVRLTAEELATRHAEGLIPKLSDLVDEAWARAREHPWVADPRHARFMVWCSEHPAAVVKAGEAIEPVEGAIDWPVLARHAFYEDLMDQLSMKLRMDLGLNNRRRRDR